MSLPKSSPSLSEQVLEIRNQAVNAIRHFNERWKQRPTTDNLRLVERYLDHEIHIIVCFTLEGVSGEYDACFERRMKEGLNEHTPGSALDFIFADCVSRAFVDALDHLASDPSIVTNSLKDVGNSEYDAVLVDDVQPMELPERIVPCLVRFGSVDCVYGCLRQALYFSAFAGFVFRGTVEDREVSPSENSLIAGSLDPRELVGQVIESGSQVVENVTSGNCNDRRNLADTRNVMDVLSGFRVRLDFDGIRLGIPEGLNFDFQVTDVLFGPFNFYANKPESFFSSHSATIREQV